ncbi:MAG TPA: adenylosuccinate synthase [Polyangia bacterium]|jgi:adenylosuccinate synthase|nr:adenylosuccinate synthase [Polyangia bacterium]
MAVVVIVGAQWGDEGKGKIVDLLTQKAHAVVRWGGGANAGHTLVVDGKKYVTHVIPSGVLRPGVACVLGEGMVIDPNVLVDEVRTFRGHGLLARDEDLVVAERAHLTLPYHKEMDRLREELPAKIGTTKRGIGPTYESKAARSGIRVADLMRPQRFRALVDRNVAEIGPTLEAMGGQRPDAAEITSAYLALGEEIRPFVRDASRFVYDQIRAGRNVLFEGAQGVLLDLDHGTYPFVTSSSTTAGGACSACGIGPTSIDSVLGISKAYATRVGLGAFPTELLDDTGALLRKRGNEFGSTTGRPRRCGWLDLPALRLAIRLSGIGGLAITKVDVLSGLESVKLCVSYQLGGKRLDEMPLDPDDLAAAQPVYEELPGWPETASEADLPPNAQRYLARVSELAGIPIWMTSVGPGRVQTLLAQNPFG